MIIAQISDTHIVPQNQHWKSKPETRVVERLTRVITHINNLQPKPDVVLLTGDTIDKGGKEAYSHLKDILKPLTVPLYIIPGNHDHRSDMQEAFAQEKYMPAQGFIQYGVEDYPVRLIALDTTVPNIPSGMLCKERLQWLNKTLLENPTKPTLLFMHHPPIKIGQKILDHVRCFFEGDFEGLVKSFPNIIGIVSGHYHRPCSMLFGGTLCFVAPSVAPIHFFESASADHASALDLANPSFALHKWGPESSLVSEVVQVIEPNNRLPL